MSNPSFYDKLGVSPNASKEEIRKAYRSLSLKYHPDRNQGKPEMLSKSQEINEAYETLGDDEKKRQYDNQGKVPPFAGMGGGHPMDDLLSSLFSRGGMPMGGGFRVNINGQEINLGDMGGPGIRIFRQQAMSKPTPIIKNVEVEMSKLLEKHTIPLEVERWITENGEKMHELETLYIEIPQGVDDNEIIVLKEKGNVINQDNNTVKGDIKIFIKVKNDTEYKRQGLDLMMEKKVSLKESLCGFVFEIKSINGKSYTLNNTKGSIIQNGHHKVIPNLGLKRVINGTEHVGKLVIQFKIEYPSTLTDEQIDKLSNILD